MRYAQDEINEIYTVEMEDGGNISIYIFRGHGNQYPPTPPYLPVRHGLNRKRI